MRCLLRLQNKCGNYLLAAIFYGIHSCVPEMLIQLGEAETAVYFRTFERIGTFCERDALYLVCTPFILEADADALFCQPLL